MADPFEKRLRRAELLRKEWPFAADLLGFLSGVFSIQQEFYRAYLDPNLAVRTGPSGGLVYLDRIIAWTEQHGPPGLADAARALGPTTFPERCAAVESYLGHDPSVPLTNPADFFWTVLVQPYEMSYSLDSRKPSEEIPAEPPSVCPRCRHHPVVSVLREDKGAETVRRSLVCFYCFLEWDFPRILCPSCREEKPEKLPRYTAQEIPWMRVEACDACRTYIKSVDLTLNWDADPIVDELASTPLDVIARDHGYAKITPNLAGI